MQQSRRGRFRARYVLLSLPGPAEVSLAVLGEGGVMSATPLPDMIIDLSTSSVAHSPHPRAVP
ncbi:MAG: hypothetical protein R2706_03025 [Acidimicrobiales bacterium]